MATHRNVRPGVVRRLMDQVALWSQAMDYSAADYTMDRITFVERELAELRDRMRQLEASRHNSPDSYIAPTAE